MDKIAKYLNVKAILLEIVVPYLEKFASDSSNPYDDKLVVWFKEWVEKNF